MTGESDLSKLLRSMHPVLRDHEYVFCSIDPSNESRVWAGSIFEFREDEGLTVVLPRPEAERAELAFTYQCRLITLSVHSSLEAVGFLAIITAELAKHGISANAV